MPEPVTKEHLVAAARDMEGTNAIAAWALREGIDTDSLATVCVGLLDSIVENCADEAGDADPTEAAALAFLTGAILGVKAARAADGPPTTEQLAVEHLHEWLAQRGESYRYAVVRPQSHEPASVADLEVLLVGDEDYENATDADPILGNALLGALGKVLAQREADR